MLEAAAYPQGRTLGGVLVEIVGDIGCPNCDASEFWVAPDLERFHCPECGQGGDAITALGWLGGDNLRAALVRLKARCDAVELLREIAHSPDEEYEPRGHPDAGREP